MKKFVLILFTTLLASCGYTYDASITCYTSDGKVYYHAEKVSVSAIEGHYYVRDENEKLTVVSGNCVAK